MLTDSYYPVLLFSLSIHISASWRLMPRMLDRDENLFVPAQSKNVRAIGLQQIANDADPSVRFLQFWMTLFSPLEQRPMLTQIVCKQYEQHNNQCKSTSLDLLIEKLKASVAFAACGGSVYSMVIMFFAVPSQSVIVNVHSSIEFKFPYRLQKIMQLTVEMT